MSLFLFDAIGNAEKLGEQFKQPFPTLQPPPPSFSSFSSNFTHIIRADENKMLVVNQPPLEVLLSLKQQQEQQKELIETKEKEEIEEKEEIKEISLEEEAENLLESCEEYEAIIAEMEGMIQTLVTRIQNRGKISYPVSFLITKYVEPAIKAEEAADSLKEEISSPEKKETKIMKELDEFDESLIKIDPKLSIIEESINKIEENKGNEKFVINEASRIASLSDLETLLEKDAKIIKDKAFEDSKEEREERIDSAKALINSFIEMLEKAEGKLGSLVKQGKKEIPPDFYEKNLSPLLQDFPKSIQDYIKYKSKDRMTTPGELIRIIDEIIDWLRSDRFLKILDNEVINSDLSGKNVREILEEALKKTEEFMKAKRKLEDAVARKDNNAIIQALEEMKVHIKSKPITKRLAEFKERLGILIEMKQKAEMEKIRKKKEIESIEKEMNEIYNQIARFLDEMGPFFQIFRSIKIAVNQPNQNISKAYLEMIQNLLEKLRETNSIAIETKNKRIPEYIYLKKKYDQLKKSKFESKKEYRDALLKEIEAFSSLYKDDAYKWLKDGSVEEIEEWISVSLKRDPKEKLKCAILLLNIDISLYNMAVTLQWKQTAYSTLLKQFLEKKISEDTLVKNVNRIYSISPTNGRAFPAILNSRNIKKEMFRDIDLPTKLDSLIEQEEKKEREIPEYVFKDFNDILQFKKREFAELQIKDFNSAAEVYIQLLIKYKKEKTKPSLNLINGIAEFLSNAEYLVHSYNSLVSKFSRNEYELMDDLISRELLPKSMSLFFAAHSVVDKEGFFILHDVFERYLKALSINHLLVYIRSSSLNEMTQLMATTYLKYSPNVSFSCAMNLYYNKKYNEAIKMFQKILKKSNSNYEKATILLYMAEAYKSLGKFDKMADCIISIPSPDDMKDMSYVNAKLYKLLELMGLMEERKDEFKTVALADIEKINKESDVLSRSELEFNSLLQKLIELY